MAQNGDGVSIEVSDCIELDSPDERLACFESRVDEAVVDSGRETDASERSEHRDEVDTRDSTASSRQQERFGLGDDDDEEQEREEREELFGTIAGLRERLPNSYIITLENGQVWRQMRPERYHLTEGLEVRIYPTRWGESYRLTAEELRGFIQVERIR